MRLVAPSMLSADFLDLGKDVDFVNDCADIFHLDVMDGSFVPNISFGFPVIEAVGRKARRPMDVHLMIVRPEKYLKRVADAGAAMTSFHLEAAEAAGENPLDLLRMIRSYGVKAGIAVNPDFPLERLFPYIGEADYVLIMSVFAGFGGQKFIKASYSRIRAVRSEIARRDLDCMIEVDGGITVENADKVSSSGADILVAGSSIFHSPDPKAAAVAIKGLGAI